VDLRGIQEKLDRSGGGCAIAHASANLEMRVEVFVSPGPGEVRYEARDLLYLVLEGSGVLGVENDEMTTLFTNEATVVPAGTRHVVFGNPRLALLTVAVPGWARKGEQGQRQGGSR
jgi:mannose-6-phosphate isomerase-like protein (cupin superfamily)